MLHIWTEVPIQEGKPNTLHVEGHPLLQKLETYPPVFTGWGGHMLELVGSEVQHPDPLAPRWRFVTPFGIWVVQVNRATCWVPPAKIQAIVLWKPGGEAFNGLQIVHQGWTETDLTQAGRAYRLLLNTTTAHRQEGPSYYSSDQRPEFLAELTRAITIVLESDKPRISRSSVARKMGIDRETLARYLDEVFKVDLNRLAADVRLGNLIPAETRRNGADLDGRTS